MGTKFLIAKPQNKDMKSLVPGKPFIEDVIEDVKDEETKTVVVSKPDRITAQGPDLTVRVPGNPNNEPVLPFSMRHFFFQG